ncbi:MAG: amidohydrolase [Firmicutes bacterium]|nr:amidohydrolase [Bacillota bacterium]
MTGLKRPRHLIDGHVHIMEQRRIRGGIRWISKVVRAYRQLDPETTPDALLQDLRRAGVDAAFNLYYPIGPGESREINRWQREMSDQNPWLLAFASLHPADPDPLAIIEESLNELGLLGFKFHPYVQQFRILDSRMDRVYRRLEEINCPVIVHTGFSRFYRLPSLTAEFLELLHRFPGMKLVASHMLCDDISLEQLAEVVEEYPNLYLDATNALWLYHPDYPAYERLPEFIRRYRTRVYFGTDYPMGMTYPVERLYKQGLTVCPDQETVEDVFWRTALRLIGREELPQGSTG